ncbi:MAG: hypothetical protein LBJ13_02815 [Puniceicoccales bacterium]|jgi:hypothetical protein|nr:hypothetical protein [Puniceicoccales bacterium]
MWYEILVFPFKLIGTLYKLLVRLAGFFAFFMVIFLIVLLCLTLSFNLWFPKALQFYTSHKSDFKMSIGMSDCSLWKGSFHFKDVEIENPEKQFSQRECLKIRSLLMQVDMRSLIKSQVEIEEAEVDVEKIVCEKGDNEDINIVKFAEIFIPKDKNKLPKFIKNAGGIDGAVTYDTVVSSRKKKRLSKITDRSSAATDGDSEKNQFIIKKIKIAFGVCELYNIANKGDHKTMKLDLLWDFHNARSLDGIVRKVGRDLQSYGVSIVVYGVLESIFNIPGLNVAKYTVVKIRDIVGGVFKGVTETIVELLPGYERHEKEDMESIDGSDGIESSTHHNKKGTGMYGSLMKILTQEEIIELQNKRNQPTE